MTVNWLQANSLEELKACGSFRELRQSIKEYLGNKIKLSFRSWKELYEVLNTLKHVAILEPRESINMSKLSNSNMHHLDISNSSTESIYFQSEVARIIYALVELDGKQRLKQLGLDKSYVVNPEKSKKWRNDIAKKIHPDVCQHPKASDASIKLVELYKEMAGQ